MDIPPRNGRPMFISMAALLLLAIGSGSAIAQAPANDTIAGATPAIVGFNYETLDTTKATTDVDDSQLNQSCRWYPATDASVWYVYNASSNVNVIVDVSQSSYIANIIVGTGTPDNLNNVYCGYPYDNTHSFRANAGETYYILAVDSQEDGGGNGGNLKISFDEAPAPVLEEFTVNRNGQFDSKTGIVTISGSYTCSNGDYFEVYTDATQTVGRFIFRGFNYSIIIEECDQQPHPWTTDVYSSNGKFGGGKLIIYGSAWVCTQYDCDYKSFGELKVQLSGGSRR